MSDYTETGILPASRELLSNEIEESVLYDRTDGKHVEMAMAFIDMQDPLLLLALCKTGTDPMGNFDEEMVFTVAEARLLRDLLNRPSVAAILDETKDDKARRPAGFSKDYLDQLAQELDA